MTYSSPAAPQEFDVITGRADSMKEFLARAKPLRMEIVNGISAKVMEVKDGQAKQYGVDCRSRRIPGQAGHGAAGGAAVTVLEVKHLSFAKPPASAFTRPRGCKVIAGESTATGGHAEFGTEAPPPSPPPRSPP